MYRTILFVGLVLLGVQIVHAEDVTSITQECANRMAHELHEERNAYRDVQYAVEQRSVLGTKAARTTDLVPYLVTNYHALDCRLRLLCQSLELSHGHLDGAGVQSPEQPIGCARLFSARGRWWNEERRPRGFRTSTIEECSYSAIAQADPDAQYGFLPGDLLLVHQCEEWVEHILQEERQMLRLLVAGDSAHRGSHLVAGVFQAVLSDVRDSFLEPLRGLVDLFGSIIHPIPCLLAQCN